tara:strand:+ start:3782 stop:7963 length:4182 start_codon:yes stop_codon:yes gene_type:complete
MAEALEPGGATHAVLSDILKQIRKSNTRAEKSSKGGSVFSGITIKEAIALKLLGEKGINAIAKGLGALAKVIDGMKTGGKDAKEKMEALGEGISAIQGLGKAILKFAGYLVLATPLLIIGIFAAPLFAGALFLILMAVNWGARSLAGEETREFLTALGDVGDAIFRFGWKLALSLLIYPFALMAMLIVAPTIILIGYLFKYLVNMKFHKGMKKMSKALMVAGTAILWLGVTLALFGIIFPAEKESFQTLGMVALVVLGLGFIFWIIGKKQKQIYKGAVAMAFVGLSIIVIALAVKFFEAALPEDKWGFFAALGVALAGLALVFWLAGKAATTIFKGAVAMAFVGLALIIISFGVMLLAVAIKDMNWENIGMMAAIIGGLAIVFGLAGAAASFILPGALAMAAVGGALIVLGIGTLIMAMAIKDMDWEKVGMMGAIILGLGVSFALAGVGALFILMGAGAFLAVGAALIVVGAGLLIMAEVFKGEGWKNMVATHHESDGFLGFGGGPVSNLQTLMEAVGYSFIWNPISVAGMLGGALGMGAVGLAMLALAPGINAMSKVFKGTAWKSMIATHHYEAGWFPWSDASPISNIMHLVTQLGAAFNLGWASFGIMLGAKAMVVVGKSLMSLALGVKFFMNTGINPGIAWAIGMMVKTIASPFGIIGKLYGGGTGFFGLGPSPLMEGVRATQGMGKALTSIAEGMVQMAKLRFPQYNDPKNPEKITGYTTLTGGDMNKVSTNVMMMVMKLGAAFGTIGKMYPREPRGGLLGFYGFTKPSPVSQGIASMSGMGEVLTSIAGGMVDMAKMKFPVYGDPNKPTKITEYITLTGGDLDGVMNNIIYMIEALAEGFAFIGRKYPRKPAGGILGFYGFSQDSDLGQGVNAMTGMGDVLTALAKSFLDMAGMKFPVYGDPNNPLEVTEYITLTGGDIEGVVNNILFMIESVAEGFASIGRKYGGWWLGGGDIADGVEAMKEVAPVMVKILDPIKKFLQTKGVDMKSAPRDMANLLKGMTTMFERLTQIGSFDIGNVAWGVTEFFNAFKNEDYRFGNFLLSGQDKSIKAMAQITTMFQNLAAIKNIWQTAMALNMIGRAVAGMRSEETASFSTSSSSSDSWLNDSSSGSSSGSSSKKGYGEVLQLVGMLGGDLPMLKPNAFDLSMISFAYHRMGKVAPEMVTTFKSLLYCLDEISITMTAHNLKKIATALGTSEPYIMINSNALHRAAKAYERIGRTIPFGGWQLTKLVESIDEVDLSDQAESLESMAESFTIIAKASKELEIEALKESTKMFNALAYLSEQGGEDAIEALGDELIEAIKKLALMIADFEGTVKDAKDDNKSFVSNVIDGANNAANKLFGFNDNKSDQSTPAEAPTEASGGEGNNEMVSELRLLNQNISAVLEEMTG